MKYLIAANVIGPLAALPIAVVLHRAALKRHPVPSRATP